MRCRLRDFLLGCALCSLMLGLAESRADDSAPGAENQRYFFFQHVPGPGWDHDKPVFQQDWEAHLAYMRELTASGHLVLGGPFKDDSGAFGILLADSLEHAQQLTAADPAVSEELVRVEVRPWHPVATGEVTAKPW